MIFEVLKVTTALHFSDLFHGGLEHLPRPLIGPIVCDCYLAYTYCYIANQRPG